MKIFVLTSFVLSVAEPLTNRKCEHVYEKATIFELLNRPNSRIRCPVVGCRNREFISRAHLYEDVYIAAQIRQQNAAAALETNEDSADETIQDIDTVQLNDTELGAL